MNTANKLALGALLLGILSFLHLFGVEKAAMAVIFGVWALRENDLSRGWRGVALCGIVLALGYLAVMCVLAFNNFHGMSQMLQPLAK